MEFLTYLRNAVQLILSILLLKSRQISVLKLSLLGTILSNLLLTTGLSFLLGGVGHITQYFNVSLAQTISMFLLLAVTSLVIPSAAHMMTDTSTQGILAQSRGISVVILVSYALWLLFTLSTHRKQFDAPSMKAIKRESDKVEGAAERGVAAIGAGTAAASGGGINMKNLLHQPDEEEEEEEEEEMFETPRLSVTGASITLIISVVLVAFNTEFATDSIQGILQRRHVSQTFLSLIILPILSIDPLAIEVAIQDTMNISISLTLERCMQTCLLLVPLTVLLAWCMGIDEMNLEFDGFVVASLFASIVIVSYVVQEGQSNW
jgi:Ca2+:H+ antiporter